MNDELREILYQIKTGETSVAQNLIVVDARIDGVDFRSSDISYLVSQKSIFSCCNMSHSNLSGASFDGVAVKDTSLLGANLSKASFYDCSLEFVDLKQASMIRAEFTNVSFKSVDFDGADLLGASFDSCDLRGVDLKKAKLEGVHLFDCAFDESIQTAAGVIFASLKN